jgi:hypothetical protein
MFLVLNTVTMTTAATSKHRNDHAAAELANGFVTESDDDFIGGLLDGVGAETGCDVGGSVVAPIGTNDDGLSFTAEIAVDTMDACQDLADMFTTQMADPTSALMSCSGGALDPCWTIDPSQDLNTQCIDTSDGGGRR